MKKYLPFFVITLCVTLNAAKAPGLIGGTFNLENLDLDDYYFTPNGENSNLKFTENEGVDYFWNEIYSNPTTDIVTLEISEKLDSTSVLNATGRIVLKNTTVTNNTINVSSLKTGIYFIKIFTNQGSAVKRFIKQ